MHEMPTIASDDSVAWCVSESVSRRACVMQKPLHGSRSCLGWRLQRAQRTCVLDGGPDFLRGFDAAFAKLVWPFVSKSFVLHCYSVHCFQFRAF